MLKDYKRPDEKLGKNDRKEEIERLRSQLVAQQQTVLEAKIPVIVMVEGWDCAGKGNLINELICEMDPRFYSVSAFRHTPESEERYPFLKKL